MDQEFKKLWIAALKSGEFRHDTGQLYRAARHNDWYDSPEGYCCLGVACALKGATFSERGSNAVYKGLHPIDDPHSALLPSNLAAEIGITKDQESALAELNDRADGDRFPQSVIDYLEAL